MLVAVGGADALALWSPKNSFWRRGLWTSRPEGIDNVPTVPIEQIKT